MRKALILLALVLFACTPVEINEVQKPKAEDAIIGYMKAAQDRNYEAMVLLSSGKLLERNRNYMNYINNLKRTLNEAELLLNKKILQEEEEIKDVLIEKLYEDENEAEFKVIYMQEGVKEKNFKLRYEKGWKIYDMKNGEWLNEEMINGENKRNNETLKKLDEILRPLRKQALIKNKLQLTPVSVRIKDALIHLQEGEDIIHVVKDNVDVYNGEVLILAEFYFNDDEIYDDFLDVQRDFSELFKVIFSLDEDISLVYLKAIGNVKDEYGNIEERDLGEGYMIKDVYEKINWEGFEFVNLEKITKVSYTGRSFYKTLEDVRESIGIEPVEESEYRSVKVGKADLL